MIARESEWTRACEERLEQLVNYPWPVEPARVHAHAREIRRQLRRLFWARYGAYRAAVIGTLVGSVGGAGLGILLWFILQPFL